MGILAVLSGFIFGVLLQKGNVGKFDTIVGQLLLKDFTVIKIILTSIVVGSAGIYTLHTFGALPTFHLSSTPLVLSLLGGTVFGIGMSIMGYCPGTALVALAEGSKDMIFGVSGMIVGSIVYNEVSPIFNIGTDAFSQKTLLDFFQASPGFVIGGLAVALGVFAFFERKSLRDIL